MVSTKDDKVPECQINSFFAFEFEGKERKPWDTFEVLLVFLKEVRVILAILSRLSL